VRLALCILLVSLVACSRPLPRDITYFETNPAEAERVAKACAAGERNPECSNAQGALARLRTKARLERYRKGFE
jgi:hypothetical protein